MSGDDFEYEYIVNGDSLELEDPEQDLLFTALEKSMENERITAERNDMSDTYDFIDSNFYRIY